MMSVSTVKALNDYKVLVYSGLALPDSAGANVTSVSTSAINEDLSNKKFIVQVEITEVCAGDGGLDIAIQGSFDGDNWVDLDASVGLDVDTTGLNTGIAVADLSNLYAPMYRLKAYTDGTDTQDAAALTLSLAYKPV
jgi:hypothetical protein